MAIKVLLVDDDLDVQVIVKTALESEGFSVKTSSDAVSGIREALSSPPDIILLDIMMPGTDGFEACKSLKVKGLTKEVPIVMITAKADEADQAKAARLGAVDYITKPFDPMELGERLKEILEKAKKNK